MSTTSDIAQNGELANNSTETSFEQKRPREETSALDENEPPCKQAKCETAIAAATPKPRRHPEMFYPDTYNEFDPECLVCEGEPQKSAMGGGSGNQIIYIKYLNKNLGKTHPLCVQAPKLFMPAGLRKYSADKKTAEEPAPKGGDAGTSKSAPRADNVNVLCSLGRDWENNANMVKFKDICDKIERACARLCIEKGSHRPFFNTQNADQLMNEAFAHVAAVAIKQSDKNPDEVITFPPSIKLNVKSGAGVSRFWFERQCNGTVVFDPIPMDMLLNVQKHAIVPMIHFDWIYRRKIDNKWKYSVHLSIHQGIVSNVDTSSPTYQNGSQSIDVVI